MRDSAVNPWEHLGSYLAVFFGGALGTAARYTLSALAAPGDEFAALNAAGIMLLINTLSAFGLGVLVMLVRIRESGAGWLTPRVQLFAGTGFLGGFSTYSALSVAIWESYPELDIAGTGFFGTGVLILVQVLLPVLAAMLGFWLAGFREKS